MDSVIPESYFNRNCLDMQELLLKIATDPLSRILLQDMLKNPRDSVKSLLRGCQPDLLGWVRSRTPGGIRIGNYKGVWDHEAGIRIDDLRHGWNQYNIPLVQIKDVAKAELFCNLVLVIAYQHILNS